MVENPKRATAILGGFVMMIVLVAFVHSLKPIEQEAQAVGAKMAKTWMQESVQRYRHAWLVKGEPKTMSMDGFELTMTEGGLVSPFMADGALDCGYWLAVHYPQRKMMASELSDVHGTIESQRYQCRYTYQNGQRLVVISTTRQLKIRVEMSSG
ncbi:MSHA biogenesis protein MshF [Vibrio alfacsensis]|uniref:MSHA biogenesis protein MshF n=1 Tax=Vibrio alfacsensis TaxID=1074311 RepID=UPI0040688F7E